MKGDSYGLSPIFFVNFSLIRMDTNIQEVKLLWNDNMITDLNPIPLAT